MVIKAIFRAKVDFYTYNRGGGSKREVLTAVEATALSNVCIWHVCLFQFFWTCRLGCDVCKCTINVL